MSSNEIDLQKLCFILDPNNSKTPEQNKECYNLYLNYTSLPRFGPILLSLACNKEKKVSSTISQSASIQLKNYVNDNWKFTNDNEYNKQLIFKEDERIIIISDEDKNYIRKNILEGILYAVEKENIKILKHFTQCVKKILNLDYKDLWQNDFMNFVLNCLNSQNQNQIYAGITLFFQLSKIYEFQDDENQLIYNEAFKLVNEKFIFFIDMCKGIKNNVEALILYKLYKIFLKNFQGSVPSFVLTNDVYKCWSNYLVQILKIPVGRQYINEKNSNFWKLRRICLYIISRVTQKYRSRIKGDEIHNNFRQILFKEYIPQYYDLLTVIYSNCNKNEEYIDDQGKYFIYNFYYFLLDLNEFREKIIQLFCQNDLILEEVIKDCTMPKSDLEAWVDSPKEYIGQKEEELGTFNTKKFRAMKIITFFMDYKDKKTKNYILFDKLYNYFYNAIIKDQQNLAQEENNIKNNLQKNPGDQNYLRNPLNIPYCLRKESILYLLKKNNDIIGKKVDTDNLIQKLILPSLHSPCGLLREQCCHFISYFEIKNDELLKEIIRNLCYLMENDPQLQVRLYACIALGNCFNKETTINMIKGNVKKILEISLKLMDETDVEQIMDNLQQIIKFFTGEAQQYIVELSDYLIKYFQRIVEKEKNMEEDDKYMDSFTIKTNIVTTFTSFIKFFVNNNEIYPKITKYIDTLIDYYITKSDSPEEGMDLIEEVLKHAANPNSCFHIFKFFVPLIQTVIGTEEELNDFNEKFKGQVFTGIGYDCILDLAKIVSAYIVKDPNTLLNLKDKNGVIYIVYATKLIERILEIAQSRGGYSEAKYCLGIIMTLFECYKGKMDKLMTDLIEYISHKLSNNAITDKNLILLLLNLISICFIYDPIKCLNLLNNKNITSNIFNFWFTNISKIETKTYLKYNIIAICSIIKIDLSQQDNLIKNNMNKLIQGIFSLIKKLNDRIEKEEEYECEEFEDDNEKDGLNDENFLEKEGEDINEQVKKIVSGEPTDIKGNDEEINSYDELDEDDEPLTEFEKLNTFIYVKNILNDLGQNQEMNKIIVESLGDKLKILDDIFKKEEQRMIKKKKNEK